MLFVSESDFSHRCDEIPKEAAEGRKDCFASWVEGSRLSRQGRYGMGSTLVVGEQGSSLTPLCVGGDASRLGMVSLSLDTSRDHLGIGGFG